MIDFGKANNLADIIEAAHEAERKFEAQVWFRGQSEYKWQLKPSVHRRYHIHETQFFQHFRLRAPSMAGCPKHEDYITWLPLMQHYGLPTDNQTISVLAPRTDKRMAVQLGNYTIHGT